MLTAQQVLDLKAGDKVQFDVGLGVYRISGYAEVVAVRKALSGDAYDASVRVTNVTKRESAVPEAYSKYRAGNVVVLMLFELSLPEVSTS